MNKRLFLALGLLIFALDVGAKTTFLGSLLFHDVTLMHSLFDSGNIDVNEQDSDGTTYLMKAVLYDNFSAIKFLLKNGANPDIKDNNGETVLMHVARMHHLSIGLNGRKFFVGGMPNEEFIHLLDKNGIKVNPQDYDRIIAWKNLGQAYSIGPALRPIRIDGENLCLMKSFCYSNLFHFFLENGATFDIQNNDGETALDILQKVGCQDCINEFLSKQS